MQQKSAHWQSFHIFLIFRDQVEICTNEHLEKCNELKRHISICHLNTQSMSSTFDEFSIYEKPYKL